MSAAEPFTSRWVPLPGHCRLQDDVDAAARGVPGGRRRRRHQAVRRAPTSGLLVCDAPDAASAARFTRSGTAAAPVLLTRERCRLDGIRAIAVNSGNANAATGSMGLQDAAKMQGAGAMAAGVGEDQVAVCSTGVIGVPLDARAVVKGLAAARAELRADGAGDLQRAIMTTDLFEKRAAIEVDLPGGTVRLTRAVQGRGDDPAELRDDALLRADGRRAERRDGGPAAVGLRAAQLRPHLGRRAALDERHRDPPGERRLRRRRRAGVRRRAARSARRSTRCCASWRWRSSATARAASASAASSCAAGTPRASSAPRARSRTPRS